MARASGKVVRGEVDDNTDYKTSAKFFQKMQNDVKLSLRDDDESNGAKRKYEGSENARSSKFKL